LKTCKNCGIENQNDGEYCEACENLMGSIEDPFQPEAEFKLDWSTIFTTSLILMVLISKFLDFGILGFFLAGLVAAVFLGLNFKDKPNFSRNFSVTFLISGFIVSIFFLPMLLH
jgi:hypothetical protein